MVDVVSSASRIPGGDKVAGPGDERRQLTVFFCDLVASTSLSGTLDPEDLADVLGQYQRSCLEVIDPLGGYVAQWLGDGILAYFGFPLAHDDDAIRAVRSGLGILEAVDRLNEHLARRHGVRLAVRIGIHTGVAIISRVGSGANRAELAVGETPNIAARVQAAADRHTVVISGATERLVRGWFDYQTLGSPALKGVAQPVALFRVMKANDVRTTFDIAKLRGLSPLVGRSEELARLTEAWARTQTGTTGAVLVDGEAGIGKSRLVEELKTQVVADGGTVLELRASPYHDRSALHPPIDLLQRSFGFTSAETSEQRRDKFDRACDALPSATPDIRNTLTSLLSITNDDDPPPSTAGPVRMRRIQSALATWMLECHGEAPALFVWEDIHWLDPSSLELLDHFLERAPGRRVLTVVTARSEYAGPLPKTPLERIRLDGLAGGAIRELVDNLASPAVVPVDTSKRIVQLTDGVPLFVEELTRSLLESGALEGWTDSASSHVRDASWIPPTLRSSLLARLDRLPEGREVARAIAIAGREIADDVLRTIWPLDDERLDRGLTELRDARLVQERWENGERRWAFSHALTQEIAYESILRSKRRHYHLRIATALEAQPVPLLATQPELLAKHYALAGDPARAADRYYQAGRLAIDRSAHVEAIDHLRHGLAMLDQLPETPEILQQRLDFLVALGPPEIARRGYAAPEVGAVFDQARLLCSRVPGSRRLFGALQGLQVHSLVRGDLDASLGLSRELVSLARQLESPALHLEGTLRLAISLYAMGDLSQANAHFDTDLLPALSRDAHRPRRPEFGQDAYVCTLCHSALVAWLVGLPDEAARRVEMAMEAGRALNHPFTMSWALLYASLVHALRGNHAAAATHAADLAALCTRHGFSYRLSQAHILLYWAQVRDHQPSLGLLADAIRKVRAHGAAAFMPLYFGFLADASLFHGDVELGFGAANDGIAAAEDTLEMFYVAELYRLRAVLRHLTTAPMKAQSATDLHRSRVEAEARGAHSLALRTALSHLHLHEHCTCGQNPLDVLRIARSHVLGGATTSDVDAADTLLQL